MTADDKNLSRCNAGVRRLFPLAKEPPHRNPQTTRKRLRLVVHDVALQAFDAGNSGLIHHDSFGGQTAGQIVLRNGRPGPEPRFADPFANDVSVGCFSRFFHAMRTSHGTLSENHSCIMWTKHNLMKKSPCRSSRDSSKDSMLEGETTLIRGMNPNNRPVFEGRAATRSIKPLWGPCSQFLVGVSAPGSHSE